MNLLVAVRPVRTTNAATRLRARSLTEWRTRGNTAGEQRTTNRRRGKAYRHAQRIEAAVNLLHTALRLISYTNGERRTETGDGDAWGRTDGEAAAVTGEGHGSQYWTLEDDAMPLGTTT